MEEEEFLLGCGRAVQNVRLKKKKVDKTWFFGY